MRRFGVAVGSFLSGGLALALPPADAADASTPEPAQATYAEGRFADAARTAEGLGIFRGFALAVRPLTLRRLPH